MENATNEPKAKIVYFSHGGGPLPILGDEGHLVMVDFMKRASGSTQKATDPGGQRSLEEKAATLLVAQNPTMFYDYYGSLRKLMRFNTSSRQPRRCTKDRRYSGKNGIPAKLDPERGFDHDSSSVEINVSEAIFPACSFR